MHLPRTCTLHQQKRPQNKPSTPRGLGFSTHSLVPSVQLRLSSREEQASLIRCTFLRRVKRVRCARRSFLPLHPMSQSRPDWEGDKTKGQQKTARPLKKLQETKRTKKSIVLPHSTTCSSRCTPRLRGFLLKCIYLVYVGALRRQCPTFLTFFRPETRGGFHSRSGPFRLQRHMDVTANVIAT